MKYLLIFLAITISSTHATLQDKVDQKDWIHGAEDCKNNKDPTIDMLQFNDATVILRQNICVHYEAPFIYILFGEHTVFVQDTGATTRSDKFPLYQTLQMLITQWKESHNNTPLEVLVTHSHSHNDHTAADVHFRDKPGVTLIEPNAQAIRQYFGFTDWPNEEVSIDLGGRELTIIPTPGHHDESITVYDSQTHWLLSGDNIYPGRLYIKNWNTYKSSIQRLVAFSKINDISAIMGTHIEMSSTPGQAYPIGSTYQPDEPSLGLLMDDLINLDSTLQQLGKQPQKKVMEKYIISPKSMLQRILGEPLWPRGL
jgi:glyoxylase-like metal-dependent hydrolase (beta-lactamase superfamily II)